MIRCSECVMPNTRPDHVFVDGVCPACINAAKKPDIDWQIREKELLSLLDRHDGRCIVPSSGGKDSTYQVLKLIELGADPLVVTASTCHLTPIGRKNIDNLARYATTIEVSPNKTVRAKLNKLGLEMVGDISWPEHAAIFSTPFRVAVDMNVPLIFYGENPQDQYGGPEGSEEAKTMTRRWTQEFGGFLGLRTSDFVGAEGITARNMADYELPAISLIETVGVEAHFLGKYLPWDSKHNAEVATGHGMIAKLPCESNWWKAENLDNAQTGLHDWAGYLKYGYGRCAAQVSIDIRSGALTRDEGLRIIAEREHIFPETYAGVSLDEVLERIGMDRRSLFKAMDSFTDWSMFRRVEDNCESIPVKFF